MYEIPIRNNHLKIFSPYSIVIGLFIALIVVFLSSKISNPLLIGLIPFLICIGMILLRFPEISFVLFLNAGIYKADPRLSFIPTYFDLTVVFGFLSLFGVIYEFLFRRIKFVFPPFYVIVFYLIMVMTGMVGLFNTPAPIYGTDKLLRLMTLTCFSLFFPFFIFNNQKRIVRFFISSLLFALITILDMLKGGIALGSMSFMASEGTDYLGVGRVVGTAIIINFFYFYMTTDSKVLKIIHLMLIPILVGSLLVTGGRGLVIATGMSIISIFFYQGFRVVLKLLIHNRLLKKKELMSISSIMFLIVIAIIIAIAFSDYFALFFRRMEILQEGGGESALSRIDRYKAALSIMEEPPKLLFGGGIGSFSVLYGHRDEKTGDYPHNIFLELGCEFGLVGLTSFVMLLFFTFKVLFINLRTLQGRWQIISMACLALLVFMLGRASMSGDINSHRFLFTWIGFIYTIGVARKDIISGTKYV